MFNKIINQMNIYIKNTLDEDTLYKIQRKLIDAGLFIKTEELITVTLILMIIIFIITLIIVYLIKTTVFIPIISTVAIPLIILVYIYYKNEKRIEEMEQELPDYLRQLSSLIKVGLGLETAFDELSKTINNALSNEIKRAILETSFGRPFDEALMDIAYKNNSNNLKYTFQLIIHSWSTGGNISEVLDATANDLTDVIMLKKERRASVMMSVMFLIISSVIATPFALGMIKLYTNFLEQAGRTNPLTQVIPVTSMGYVIIQSVLICVLIGIIMYSDIKKGIKYMFIIPPASICVYYFSQLVLTKIMGF